MAYFSPGVFVEELPSTTKPIAGVSTSVAAFVAVIGNTVQLIAKGDPAVDKTPTKLVDFTFPTPALTPVLVASWNDYVTAFGDFVGSAATTASTVATPAVDTVQHALTLAVYGFFNNGGGRAYIVRAEKAGDLPNALAALETIDTISLVLAPGATDNTTRALVAAHCAKMRDRFAILDAPDATKTAATLTLPQATSYVAVYTPWIKVFDPAASLQGVAGGVVAAAPSGHIAGVYARVDTNRGVFKAPANEPLLGALGLSVALSNSDQDTLNPAGINCIRSMNGSVLVWGARTVGGDANQDVKYVSVRRTLIFIEKSIRQGTQWVVFEPNTPSLWQQISRNVTAFLTELWRSGALFGATAAEAFYVRCDATTNPSASRDNGQVITEVGVAIARPAEFVVFRISQWAGPGA